jgi:hypothetical protein
MLLMALAMLIGVATPPVIEDHVEIGFCSADCPVQHDGHSTAVAPPLVPSAARRSPALAIAGARVADAERGAAGAPDAPRAPPSA